MEAKKAT